MKLYSIKTNKFRNKKTEVNGIKFDSKLEAKRYTELQFLLKSGIIKDLKLQQEFELQPSFKKNGKTIRAITYKSDFVYYDNERQKIIVEDTKGFRTKDYILKKKLFEYKFKDLSIEEVNS